MNRVVGQIVALLSGEDRQLRSAAARVLGALQVDDPPVIEALGRALDDADPKLLVASLGAIGALGAADAFDAVVPLLEEPGDVGQQAADALAGMGPRVLTRLKKYFPKAGPAGRRRILMLAARLRGAAGTDLIVRALENGDAEAVAEIGGRLAAELASASARERKGFVKKLDRFLAGGASKAQFGTISTALDLLARIVGTAAQDRLLGYAAKGNPPRVRQRALEALAEIAPKGALAPEVVTKVLGFLREKDFTHVVAPAMAVLERTALGPAHEAPLFACLRGDDPALRRFAATALGQADTKNSAAALLVVLRGDNPDLQKRAADSLSRQSAAVPLVSAALVDAPDPQSAWVMARILLPHVHALPPARVTALASAAASWLEPGDPRAEAIVTVLRERHLTELEAACIRRVKRLKRQRKAGAIVNLLRPLVREGTELGAAARYELAIAEVMRGRMEVLRDVRLDHPGLEILEGLLHDPEFALGTKLKRDKSVLEPEEYYLIGCHFAERTYADRAFGGDILRWLAQTFEGDTHATAAAHKLHMEGFAPPPPKASARRRASRSKRAASRKKAASGKKDSKKKPAAPKASKAAKAPKSAARKAPARKTVRRAAKAPSAHRTVRRK